jgi:hypothetical protein
MKNSEKSDLQRLDTKNRQEVVIINGVPVISAFLEDTIETYRQISQIRNIGVDENEIVLLNDVPFTAELIAKLKEIMRRDDMNNCQMALHEGMSDYITRSLELDYPINMEFIAQCKELFALYQCIRKGLTLQDTFDLEHKQKEN